MATISAKTRSESNSSHVIKNVLRVMVREEVQDPVRGTVEEISPDTAVGAEIREYENIIIRLRDFDGERLAVEVTESPVGRMREPDHVAFDYGVVALASRLGESSEDRRSRAEPRRYELRELGGVLAGMLFPLNVREIYRQSAAWVRRRMDTAAGGHRLPGLRLVLNIDDTRLMSLPWEYVYLSEHVWLGDRRRSENHDQRLDELRQQRSEVQDNLQRAHARFNDVFETHRAVQKPRAWDHDHYVVVSRLLAGPSNLQPANATHSNRGELLESAAGSLTELAAQLARLEDRTQELQEEVHGDRFLVRDPGISIVRSEPLVVDADSTLEQLDAPGTRRLFLGTANPSDLGDAPANQHQGKSIIDVLRNDSEGVYEAFAGDQKLDLEQLAGRKEPYWWKPTADQTEVAWTALTAPYLTFKTLEECSQYRFDVLHYVGHGGAIDERAVAGFAGKTNGGNPDDCVRDFVALERGPPNDESEDSGSLNGLESPFSRYFRSVEHLEHYVAVLAKRKPHAIVPAEDFARVVRRMGARVVVLMSCRGSASGDSRWSGLAAALLRAGVPIVVGMQSALTADKAARFSAAFYRALAGGKSVDQALSEGRRKLTETDPDAVDFGVPVLYTCTPRAQNFRLDGS